jgi:hypothetical protein
VVEAQGNLWWTEDSGNRMDRPERFGEGSHEATRAGRSGAGKVTIGKTEAGPAKPGRIDFEGQPPESA